MLQADEPLLVGVDVGTTNIKALVFDRRGRAVSRASLPTKTHYPRPGWAYYDPEELWQQTAQAIQQAVDTLDDAQNIVGIAVASIGETGVPLDAGGDPTYDAIAWFDRRTEPQLAWLEEHVGGDELFAVTGLGRVAIFSLCKILWLRDEEPEAYQRTVRWLNTADYIAYRLCGVPATDYSLASRTFALDLHRLEWATDLLQAVGVPADLFAPLRASGTALGTVHADASTATGLPGTTTVVVGGHDHVVGAFAVGANRPGDLLNSVGTAEASFIPTAQPLTDPRMGQQGYTQGAHVAGGYYVLGGQYTSGGSVEWFRNAAANGADYATLIAEAESVPPGSLGICFLPHLRQANPPHSDIKGRGAFIGLSTDATRGALFRAVLEGISFESRCTLEPQLRYAGLARPRQIAVIGGGTRNSLHMRIKATIYNQPIRLIEVDEATALGAALLGGVGAGVYADREEAVAALDLAESVVEPVSEEVEVYERIYREVYQEMYETLRPLHHRIHAMQGAGGQQD